MRESIESLIQETAAEMERIDEDIHNLRLRRQELETDLESLRRLQDRLFEAPPIDQTAPVRMTILERLRRDFPKERLEGMDAATALRTIAESWPTHLTLTPVRQHLVDLGIVPAGQEGQVLVHEILANSGEYERLPKKGRYRLRRAGRRSGSGSSESLGAA